MDVPYGACLHGRGSMLLHAKSGVPEASVRVAAAPPPTLPVVRRHDLDDLPAEMSRRFQETAAAGVYVLPAANGGTAAVVHDP